MVSTRRKNYDRVRSLFYLPSPPDPAKPTKDGFCRFLYKLPAEVRNQIYDLSLCEPDGIYARRENNQIKLCVSESTKAKNQCKDSPPIPDTVISTPWEVNQLQYTCKQLRSETKGYALRVNDITFIGGNTPGSSSLGDCFEFLTQLAPKWLSQLQRVNIRHFDRILLGSLNYKQEQHIIDFNSKVQDDLIDICRANPHMTIHWGCPSWYLSETFCSFLLRGISITYAYRGIDRSNLVAHHGDIDENAEFWLNGKTTEEINVHNFKIHPFDFGDQTNFEGAITHAERWCRQHLPSNVTMDEWKKTCWQWFEDGI